MTPSFSPSSISMLLECPRAWMLTYNEKLADQDDSTDAADRGTAVHHALEAAGRARLARSIDPGVPASAEELVGYLHNAGLKVSARGLADARALLAELPSERMAHISDVEVAFKVDVDGVTVKGRIDRIDILPSGLCRVTDYKTAGFPPTLQELEHSPQTLLYGLAAHLALAPWAPRIEVRYHFVAVGRKTDIPITTAKLAAARALLHDAAAEVEERSAGTDNETSWPAEVSNRCATCRVRKDCKVYQEVLAAPSDEGYEGGDVGKLVDEYARANARLAILEGRKREIADRLKPLLSIERPQLVSESGKSIARLQVRSVREFRNAQEAVQLVAQVTGFFKELVAGEILSASRAKADKLVGALDDERRRVAEALLDDATVHGSLPVFEVRKSPKAKE